MNIEDGRLNVILMVGVNGVGKTTTIGKLAHRYKMEGKKLCWLLVILSEQVQLNNYKFGASCRRRGNQTKRRFDPQQWFMMQSMRLRIKM